MGGSIIKLIRRIFSQIRHLMAGTKSNFVIFLSSMKFGVKTHNRERIAIIASASVAIIMLVCSYSYLKYEMATYVVASPVILPASQPPASQPPAAAPPQVDLPELSSSTVPILMYHHIKDPINPLRNRLDYGLSVTPQAFSAQMASLSARSFRTIPIDHLFQSDQTRKIVLTFDDGYKDVFTNAFPLMQQYGYTGTVFIITRYIGRDGYMTVDDLAALSKAGWTIGSHTLDHPDLKRISPRQAEEEINLSKTDLEKALGIKIDSFCYPSGQYTDQIVNTVNSAGYHYAVTTKYGKHNSKANILTLERIRVSGSDDLKEFEKKVY